jgi:two-component system KDP operon response regulator KdpE
LITQPNILARILVVDDEPQIRRFLRISLCAHGYSVLEAGRGADAPARRVRPRQGALVG